MVAYSTPPEPATPLLMDTYPPTGFTLASSTEHASSLSGCTLCRHSSAIRTGCAKERPSGSEEGCALKARGNQSPEMEAAVKPSSQPRTKSCVVSGDGHCEA
jgi:hypothetical protein